MTTYQHNSIKENGSTAGWVKLIGMFVRSETKLVLFIAFNDQN